MILQVFAIRYGLVANKLLLCLIPSTNRFLIVCAYELYRSATIEEQDL